ncbi:hypothetical protein FB451DRAFT_1284257, partial [Mycena latifolia]
MDADCCGICCICVACCGLISSAFRYLPFSSAFKGCSCRCCCKDEDDFDKINFPEFEPEFTPAGERIRSYHPTGPMQLHDVQMQDSNPMIPREPSVDPNPYDAPPLPHVPSHPPPNYGAAVRDSLRSPSDVSMATMNRSTSRGIEGASLASFKS